MPVCGSSSDAYSGPELACGPNWDALGNDWLQLLRTSIEAQLYVKYGLDDDEIDFIESHVKPTE